MAEKPDNVEHRRWYQFGLRTLLMGVALVSLPLGWFGWQVSIVRERKSMLELGPSTLFNYVPGDDSKLPLIRRWLGDHAVSAFGFNQPSPETTQRYKEAFPEWDGRLDIPIP
jgi:hypothetical protein